MKASEKKLLVSLLHRAEDICAKHGLALGNGGDISAMLSEIASEIVNGEAKEDEFLKEAK